MTVNLNLGTSGVAFLRTVKWMGWKSSTFTQSGQTKQRDPTIASFYLAFCEVPILTQVVYLCLVIDKNYLRDERGLTSGGGLATKRRNQHFYSLDIFFNGFFLKISFFQKLKVFSKNLQCLHSTFRTFDCYQAFKQA